MTPSKKKVKRFQPFIEPGSLPQGYVVVRKTKSKRVTPFNRKRI